LETYAENRASHFIQDRFDKINEFLNKSLFFAMNPSEVLDFEKSSN